MVSFAPYDGTASTGIEDTLQAQGGRYTRVRRQCRPRMDDREVRTAIRLSRREHRQLTSGLISLWITTVFLMVVRLNPVNLCL